LEEQGRRVLLAGLSSERRPHLVEIDRLLRQTSGNGKAQILLERIGRFDEASISEIVRLHQSFAPHADELALARIARAREEAARQLTETRNLAKWQVTTSRLDEEERVAREPTGSQPLSAAEIVEYARSLPRLWAESSSTGRQALVQALFARLDVLGYQRLEFELTADALDLGLDAVLPHRIELEHEIGEFGRGERI